MEQTNNKLTPLKHVMIVLDLFFRIAILTALFMIGGILLDRYFETTWIFTLIGFMIMLVANAQIIIRKGNELAALLSKE